MIIADLDHFKQVNDAHGHLVGNAVLAEVGRTIMESVRAYDVGCRIGGEEFAVILPDTGLSGAWVVAERMRTAVSTITEQALPPVTISLGIAVFPEDANTLQELVRKADDAMYAAKDAGRNTTMAWCDSPQRASAGVGASRNQDGVRSFKKSRTTERERMVNEQSHIAIVPAELRGWPEIEYATQKAVARLGNLATHVDQLASKFPLNSSPVLRSQMRRAALDALTNVACGLEATSAHDYRQLMLRSLCALNELDTFARLGSKSSVVTPSEVSHLALLVQQADHAIRLGLQECPPFLRGVA